MTTASANIKGSMRERLVRGAFDLFQRQGFQKTSVSEIVAAAGGTKGAFYHYFASKDDLLVDAHVEYLEVQIAVLKEVREADSPSDVQLHDVIERMVLGVYHYPAHVTLFVEERRSIDPSSAKRASALRDEFEAQFIDLIGGGVQSGVFRQDLDPLAAALGMLGMLTWTFTWTPRRTPAEVDAIAKQLAVLAVEGVRARA